MAECILCKRIEMKFWQQVYRIAPPISIATHHFLTPPPHQPLAQFCVQFWLLFHGQGHLVLLNSIQEDHHPTKPFTPTTPKLP